MSSPVEVQVDVSADRIADRARGRYMSFLHGARSQTEQAAGRVRKGKKPVQTLSKLGVELSSISHRATTKVVKNQTRMIENQIDAFAGRLHSAARADSLRGLVRDQIRLIPANASQFVEDTRQTFSVVAEAGSEMRELFAGTVAELRGSRSKTAKPAAKKAKKRATRKAPKKAAKKTAKKTAKKVSKKASATPKTSANKASSAKAGRTDSKDSAAAA